MSQRIILQPNGRFAIFSTVAYDFILLDATVEDLIKFRVKREAQRIKETTHNTARRLSKGEAIYGPLTTSWETTVEIVEAKHGQVASIRYIKENIQ